MTRVYLDHAATTPLRPEVLDAMKPSWDGTCGNPSSIHKEGQKARKLLEEARDRIAANLDASPEELFFCSGGTEANNWALRALSSCKKRHIIVSSIEHPSVLRTCDALEREGFRITYLPVDEYGKVSPLSLEKALSSDTSVVSVMMANNEIGTIEPIRELTEIAHKHGVLFHTDAVQAVGSIPVSFHELGVDALSFSSHKFGGPTGIGGILFRKGLNVSPLIYGGEQESGRRAGTENLAGLLGLDKALSLSCEGFSATISDITLKRDDLIKEVLNRISYARLCGHPTDRLPGNAHFVFDGVDGEALLLYLNVDGFSCSSGSACTSSHQETSHVLKAIGLRPETARSALRISLGYENTVEEISAFISDLTKRVNELKNR